MNRENEEQRPIPQTFCGALQKEANCKCLVLSILIYGCLAAVTWCRCANVTKTVFHYYQRSKSTKQVPPCDDGYIYIPVAFMGMLYLVYLVECYHSPIRIDLLHSESQDSVLSKLTQLKFVQPTIWWKAITYHYVRRKRQITRYRNGDNYTTTQVYYERVNTHASTSFYFYDYCGVKDISADLVFDPKISITKISLMKGFAFSNMRSATEFEEARSRFFAEQEHRDDYMEMREGLDLGYNFSPTSLVAVLGNPWFTNSYVYWCLSALLLSWPLRIIIECNTQYANYQITKLFGVNYDTPATGEPIHASSSQLSAPGSYMLAPSYSEALLMEPAVPESTEEETQMVPSYSEALLYERAQVTQEETSNENAISILNCECPCHSSGNGCHYGQDSLESGQLSFENDQETTGDSESSHDRARSPQNARNHPEWPVENGGQATAMTSRDCTCSNDLNDGVTCQSCASTRSTDSEELSRISDARLNGGFRKNSLEMLDEGRESERKNLTRDISEPNLRTDSELFSANTQFLRLNGQSLENILENDETEVDFRTCPGPNADRAEALVLEDDEFVARKLSLPFNRCRGAIPKRVEEENGIVVNPMAEMVRKIPSSRTYFCLKSILKQNKRRYTLVTAEELQHLSGACESRRVSLEDPESPRPGTSGAQNCSRDCCGVDLERLQVNWISRENAENSSNRRRQLFRENLGNFDSRRGEWLAAQKQRDHSSSRTLIFASPIQEICPSDPFGGRTLIPSKNPPNYEEALDLPVLSRLRRSLTERETKPNFRKHHRTLSIEPEHLFCGSDRRYRNPELPHDALLPAQDVRVLMQNERLTNANGLLPGQNSTLTLGGGGVVVGDQPEVNNSRGKLSRLTRSLTERTTSRRRPDRSLRRSFTERVELAKNGRRKANINMETSL